MYGLILLGVVAFVSVPALAQTAPESPQPRTASLAPSCTSCHEDSDIESKGQGLYVPQTLVDSSVHSDVTCTDCHPPTKGVLHQDVAAELKATRASCAGCHEDQNVAYEAGAHGSGDPEGKPTCVICHGSHEIQPADSRDFVVAEANDRCSECHDERGQSFFKGNYHGKETNLGRTDVAVCADCHGAHTVLPESDPESPVNAANRLQMCASCHEGAGPNFADIQIHVLADPIPADPKLAASTLYFIIILTVTFGLFGWHMVLSIRHEWRKRGATVSVQPQESEENDR